MKKLKWGKKLLAAVMSVCMLMPGTQISVLAADVAEGTEIVSEDATQTDADSQSLSEEQAVVAETNDRFHLNYLVVGNKVVCTPGEQYFLADVGDGTETIESATLTYKNATTEVETEISADTIEAGTLLFEMNMDESQPDGEYEVTKIAVVSGGQTYLIDMAETGIEARFGVNAEVDTNADAYVEEEETADAQTDSGLQEAGITVMDAQGQEITYDNLSDALQEANEDVADNGIAAQSEINPNLVVVLDPGHGGSDSGACGYGLREKDLTLKIANYCKAKLQEYSHVEVYMTRTGDTDNNLANRVNFANQYNPDIFVSIHINAVGGRGAEVYYPNGNYVPAIGTEGRELASIIQQKLVALGLANRGIKIRNTEDGSQYPDGSPSDYLGVIKRSKEYGFPAVLVEHAFIDNSGDAYEFLAREDKVRDMGYADAEAIAQYYGLSKNGAYGSKNTIADTIRSAYTNTDAHTLIMASPSASVDSMVQYYMANAAFPAYYATVDGEFAASGDQLRTFCQMYYDEAVMEGVDPAVAFAQAMKETNFLRFGGDVKIEQFNFAGIGATGGGAAGESYANVRTGIRAQIQHLKAYASNEDLKNPCVDTRFALVKTRGCAQYVEYLGIQENPFGVGWATAKEYGYSIVNDYMIKFANVQKTTNNTNSFLNVAYATHVQSYGWQAEKTNGSTSGTTGRGKRLEAITIRMNTTYDLGITYQTHVQSYGWMDWASDGAQSGTTGQAKRLEAIRIKLTGSDADKFDVYYRVHAQTFGWLGWAKNGESAGTAGFAKRLEAIQIYVVPKGLTPTTGSKTVPFIQYGKASANGDSTGKINYATHVQSYGNQGYVADGSFSGTFGEAKRLEAIWIHVNNAALDNVSGGVTYRTHVQTFGWQDWVSDGQKSGTSGLAKRLEAIEIKLTGDLETKYDVYYRVHAQTYGWMNWAKNGEPAGTQGLAKRLEAIQIVLVPKGENPPSALPINDNRAFIMR